MSRLETDFQTLDPDGGDQDSASSFYGELNEPVTAAPRVPRARSPLGWGSLALAVAVVGALAGAVLCFAG